MINPKAVADEGFRSVYLPTADSPEIRAHWVVPAKLPYFDGHFPGNPTLPAVAMVDLTLELVRRWPEFEKAELSVLKSAKFSAVVGPGAEVEIRVTRDLASPLAAAGVEWRAVWTLLNGDRRSEGGDVAANFWLGVRT